MQLASVSPQLMDVPAPALLTLTTNRSALPGIDTESATKAHQRSPVAPSSQVQGGPWLSSAGRPPVKTSEPVGIAAPAVPLPPAPPSPPVPPPLLPPMPPMLLPPVPP